MVGLGGNSVFVPFRGRFFTFLWSLALNHQTMLGIIVQVFLSWLILKLFMKDGLSVLGFRANKERVRDFFLFFLLTAACCAAGFLMQVYWGKQNWMVNPALSAKLVGNGLGWNIKSVLFEELIFRGALLYVLIQKAGPVKAIILSAAGFGIYHWFSFGILGNPVQMVFVFLITGIMGLLLAFGYAKTFSLYIPAGIHFGWNFTQIFVFSGGPIGKGIFIPSGDASFRTDSLLIFFCVRFLPVLSALLLGFLLIKKRRQAVPDITTGQLFV